MDPRLLKQLSVIVKCGSLSRAAERLNVTQPTLTRAVQVIENQVGGPVLVRTANGVRPTDIGSRLAEVGERINDYAEHTRTLIEQWRQGLGGEVRVGVGPLLALGAINGFFPEAIADSRSVVHFVTATASTLIRQMHEGDLDLVLTPANIDVVQEDLQRQIIFHDEIGIFAGVDSPFYGDKSLIQPETLRSQHWIQSGASSGIYEALDSARFSSPAQMIFTGGIDMVISLLQTSDIMVALPKRLTLLSGRVGDDHLLDVDTLLPRRDIALWMPKRNLERPDVTDLAERLKRFFLDLDETAAGRTSNFNEGD
ncbi:LysR family transcriptional regulator [Marinobacterium sp. YM272]|uniref:LysR family transcriptional regulator n=1 Tax=Marinobacterium sp. YM272 TaxID=3421654 RepID=UPI003D7FA0DF